MQRINWIDWAKALAVITVVFCHLPQSQEWFYYRYLQACTITIFFFISGYLKKDRGNDKETREKYWHSLILPYIIYNVLVYPYWLVKYYMLNGGMPDLLSVLKPIIGALLFEHESSFAEPLNGPLWYLPAILFMHVTIDLCNKTRYLHQIMILLCIVSFFLFVANREWRFMHTMTPTGVFRRLPYYYIGYVMGRRGLLRNMSHTIELIGFVYLIPLSILFFYFHLHEERMLLHVALFYPFNLCALFGFIYGCKLLTKWRNDVITNISIGTLLIIGLHLPLIGIINYISGITCYKWHEALPLSILLTAFLYPFLIYCKKNLPFLLGKS